MARTESWKEGRIPLHTFRADIDYALKKPYNLWIDWYKGLDFKGKFMEKEILPQ